MKLTTSIWHFVQRGNHIRPHMDIEQAVDQKLGYENISKKTLDKLEAIYNATVEHLEKKSGEKRVQCLDNFKAELDSVQRGVNGRDPSKATSDLQTLLVSFQKRLVDVRLKAARAGTSTEPASTPPEPRARFSGRVDTSERSDHVVYVHRDPQCILKGVDAHDFEAPPTYRQRVPAPAPHISPRPVVPTAFESHAELRTGYVASHTSNLIDPHAMSLVEAFACKTANVAVSNETLRKLDEVFERCSGITLHACGVDQQGVLEVPVLKSYDFASPYRSGFIPLVDMVDQLDEIHSLIDDMKKCRAKTVLLEKLSAYEAHVKVAWEFWKAKESKAKTHRFSVEPSTFEDRRTALLMDQNLLHRALTWQGACSKWRDQAVAALSGK